MTNVVTCNRQAWVSDDEILHNKAYGIGSQHQKQKTKLIKPVTRVAAGTKDECTKILSGHKPSNS